MPAPMRTQSPVRVVSEVAQSLYIRLQTGSQRWLVEAHGKGSVVDELWLEPDQENLLVTHHESSPRIMLGHIDISWGAATVVVSFSACAASMRR